MTISPAVTRRAFAASFATTVAFGRAASQPAGGTSAAVPEENGFRVLTAAPRRMKLHPEAPMEAELWAFDGEVPGPVLRVRHGDEVRVRLRNRTPKPLSLHWHGVRIANAMDGAAPLTQAPVAPGQDFDYRFTPPDAGTYLVRPGMIGAAAEAAERGLSALLVVEERERAPVDREIVLLFDDWRLERDGALAPFGDALEAATIGRLGNFLAVNGRVPPQAVEVPPGSRIRLRLANLANARATRLRFDDLKVYVIGVDGQPTESFEPLRSTLPFSPGSRYDLLFDLSPEAGAKGTVTALVGPGVPLLTVAAAGEPSKRPALPPITGLSLNPLLPPAIKLQDAVRRDVVIAGGARKGPNGEPVYDGDPKRIWTVNGAAGDAGSKPLVSVKRGQPVVLAIKNTTPAVQPLHLHGHVFRLLHPFDDGWEPYFLDTMQVPENRTVRIAFMADNPGKWLLASTVLERLDTGLWTWLEVT
ncbi:MAG TPA: multicopper oxidase family protein [Beijerinckiaceae bacterium]|jgi:FtsP/CotA-like multicopper oxidase with cupredoxin domain